jgi:hypothetical protein
MLLELTNQRPVKHRWPAPLLVLLDTAAQTVIHSAAYSELASFQILAVVEVSNDITVTTALQNKGCLT